MMEAKNRQERPRSELPDDDAVVRWNAGLAQEESFWEEWLASKGGQWSDGFQRLLDPNRELEPQFTRLLDAPEGAVVRILDVGAGPLTSLAVQWPGRRVVTVAVDPLARQYSQAINRYGIQPLVRTDFGEAERLEELFADGEFDLVFSANCLDRSYDPLTAIRQMVRAVRPGGCVMLEHIDNDAVARSYQGLHQWNFDTNPAGQFVIWRPGASVVVEDALGAGCEVSTTAHPLEGGRKWLSTTVRRGSPAAPASVEPPARPRETEPASWRHEWVADFKSSLRERFPRIYAAVRATAHLAQRR